VGLGTSPEIPRAEASPRTHSDFPAPRGPWRRRTVPGENRGRCRAAWARVAATSMQISSGGKLAKVIIAAEGKPTRVIALTDGKARSDDGKGGREGPSPEEGGSQFGWERKEKFVIFPTGKGKFWSSTGREGDLVRVNPEADVGGTGEAGKVGPESIAEIEHGGGKLVANEPLTLGEARGECKVAARPGTAQFSGNKKKVTGACSRAIWGGFFGNCPQQGDGKEELAGADGFPSDDRKPELFGEERKPSIGLMQSGG